MHGVVSILIPLLNLHRFGRRFSTTELFDVEYVREEAGRADEDDLAKFAFVYLSEGLEAIIDLINNLPKSKALDGDTLDGEELFEFVRAFDPTALPQYVDVGQCRTAYLDADSSQRSLIYDDVKSVLEAAVNKMKAAGSRTWPFVTAARLGAAVRTSKPSDTSGNHHPLASALKAKSAAGAFEKFIQSSYMITMPAKRHPWFID